jgi:hypothetical protein
MKSKMCRFISDVCSGSRVGCGGSCKCRRHACRYSLKIRERGLRVVKREGAGREREDSAARSAQQRSARRAALCRATGVQAHTGNVRAACNSQTGNGYRKNRVHSAPSSWRQLEQQHAGLCSTAPATIVPFAFQVWNETGRPLAPKRLLLPSPRTHNGSRSQTRNKS